MKSRMLKDIRAREEELRASTLTPKGRFSAAIIKQKQSSGHETTFH